MTATETVVYDVHDYKVYPMTADTSGSPTYGAGIDVPGIASVSVEPNLLTAELKGDAKVIAKRGRIDKMNLQATYGKLSQSVLLVIMGGAISAPAGTSRWDLSGANSLPYFKSVFVINDADVGQVKVTIYKGQLTSATLLDQQTDQFGQPKFDLEGIPCTSNEGIFFTVENLDTASVL